MKGADIITEQADKAVGTAQPQSFYMIFVCLNEFLIHSIIIDFERVEWVFM